MNTTVKLAVASALAMAAGQALATDPTGIVNARSANTLVELWVSGATATDNIGENLFRLDDTTYRVCVPGTLDIYYYKSSSGSISQRALACTAGFTSGTYITASATTLLMYKESVGGSAYGVSPVANGTSVLFLDLSSSSNFTSACSSAVTVSTNVTLPNSTATYNTRDCGYDSGTSSASSVTRSTHVPNAGISDVDPASFVGTGGVTSGEANALRARQSVAVTFSPIVSVPMYKALQNAYGYVSGNTEDTVSLDHIPSLSSSQLRGIFNNAQAIVQASEITVNDHKLSDYAATINFSTDPVIYLCRRGDTSGTMTSFKYHFLGQGCNKNSGSNMKFRSPDTASCEASGCSWGSTYYNNYVFAGGGSGDVRACVNYHSSQNRLAVGIASAEDKPNTGNADVSKSKLYRYIKTDGAEPGLKATIEGRYPFFEENTWNDKWTSTISGAPQVLWEKLYGGVGNATAISEANRTWRDGLTIGATLSGEADVGILDVASTAVNTLFSDGVITAAEVRSSPINSQTRKTTGGSFNACNLPYKAYP